MFAWILESAANVIRFICVVLPSLSFSNHALALFASLYSLFVCVHCVLCLHLIDLCQKLQKNKNKFTRKTGKKLREKIGGKKEICIYFLGK